MTRCTSTRLLAITFLGLLVMVILLATLVAIHRRDATQSALGSFESDSPLETYSEFALSTESKHCAQTGKDIIEAGGNAVDAGVAILVCMGVTLPESLSLGGGALIVLYNRTTDKAIFLNAREVAPANSAYNMFNETNRDPSESILGPAAIAVPGALAGFWHLYSNYGSGRVEWKRLFQDAIRLARDGFPIGEHVANYMRDTREDLLKYKHLRDVYVNPNTNDTYQTGDTFYQPTLAKTLENVANAENPHEYFYTEIAKLIVKDIQKENSDFPQIEPVLTEDDFRNYKVIESESHSSSLKDGITLHTAQLPGSGDVLSFILRNMLAYGDLFPEARNSAEKANLFWHRLMETFKFAFAQRMYLGDPRFDNVTVPLGKLNSPHFVDYVHSETSDSQTYPSSSGHYGTTTYSVLDHGTAHVVVLDKDGNAFASTSTVNQLYGSKVMSPSTGLILNDQMDDFCTGKPNGYGVASSNANSIQPGKRPMSSMTPAIFVDSSGVRLVIGASGGPKITTSVAIASLRHLYLGDNIKQAIDAYRLHDQLFPDEVVYEKGFPESILTALKERKAILTQVGRNELQSVANAISRDRDGVIQANSDYRKGGAAAGV